ncbi:MAG: cytochrome C oxidase subunit IV family protein [Actinomycetia bacterium]|nr:cytochrome C oxidase subunit IV family protein [Actinomycetes bacterium]
MKALRRKSHSADPSDHKQVGGIVALALAALTIFEYLVAIVSFPPVLVWLLAAAAAKAWLIAEFFMHISQVRSERRI